MYIPAYKTHDCINIHTYMRTYIHRYTNIHTYIHIYIHTYIHTYIHKNKTNKQTDSLHTSVIDTLNITSMILIQAERVSCHETPKVLPLFSPQIDPKLAPRKGGQTFTLNATEHDL